MLFTINPSDGLPIYRQIVRQVKHAVASGRLAAGDKLPSQRDLSSELVIKLREEIARKMGFTAVSHRFQIIARRK